MLLEVSDMVAGVNSLQTDLLRYLFCRIFINFDLFPELPRHPRLHGNNGLDKDIDIKIGD
jgi:hypothetical protein